MTKYTRTITISLKPEDAGKILAAQQLSGTGTNIEAEITETFTDLGGGNYLLTSSAFDDTAKAIKIYACGESSTVLALATLEYARAATGIAEAAKSAADAASSADDAQVAAEIAGVDSWAAAEAAESADAKADQVLARLGESPRERTVTDAFSICTSGGETAVGIEAWVTNQAGDVIAGPVTSNEAGLARFTIPPTSPGNFYYVHVKSDRHAFVDYPKVFIVAPEDGFTVLSDARRSHA